MFSVNEIIVAEGKYDKIRLSRAVDALIVTTDGFGLFKNKEKLNMLRLLAPRRGIIILTDSDRAGFKIRNYLCQCLNGVEIKHAYIPEVKGKEGRKTTPGAEGLIGVEGMEDDVLISALKKAKATPKNTDTLITKTQLYCDGLIGKPGSAQKRREFLKKMGLPERLSTKAMLDVINRLLTEGEYRRLADG